MADAFYVYVHRRASDNVVFYVGKGQKNRAYDFIRRSKHWKSVANKHGVAVEIVLANVCEAAAFEHECELIRLYGRKDCGLGPLVNKSDGGEGPSGSVHTVESRKARSARVTGAANVSKRPEVRAKLSMRMKTSANPMLEDAARMKVAAANTGRKASPEARAAMSRAQAGRVVSDATRAKIAALKSGKDRGPEFRETMRLATARRWADPEKRAALVAAQKQAAEAKRLAAI